MTIQRKLAKALLFDPEGKVLLLRRSDTAPNRPGQYDLPGGNVDDGETFDQAVVREIKEEIGLEFAEKELRLVHASTNFYDELSFIRLLYVGSCSSSPSIVLSHEHDQYIWVTLERALELYDHPVWNDAIRYARDHQLIML